VASVFFEAGGFKTADVCAGFEIAVVLEVLLLLTVKYPITDNITKTITPIIKILNFFILYLSGII